MNNLMKPSEIRNVLLVVKNNRAAAWKMANELADWLQARGRTVKLLEHSRDQGPADYNSDFNSDLILVLGGDGTILSVGRLAFSLKVPLLGFNMGKVGFLAAVERHDWHDQMEYVLKNGLDIQQRGILQYSLKRDGATVLEGVAINDLVVNRGRLARVIHVDLSVDDEFISHIRSDGLIVSTPTGSSGYSLSSGGPILDPRIDAYLITPICPLQNELKPLVLPGSSRTQLVMYGSLVEKYMTIDGQEGFKLNDRDQLMVSLAAEKLLLAFLPGHSYFSNLCHKKFIGTMLQVSEDI